MNAMIDTLKFAKRLSEAGMPAPQAEAVAEAMRESTESADLATRKDLQIELQKGLAPIKEELAAVKAGLRELQSADLVTRKDLEIELAPIKASLLELQQATKADIAALEQTSKADLNEFKAEVKGRFALLQWMMAFLLAGVAALVLKAFLHG